MKTGQAARNLSGWLLAAAFAFSAFAFASAVQLRSQVTSISAIGCNYDLCTSDSQCEGGQDNHKLCDSCQPNSQGQNVCGTFE